MAKSPSWDARRLVVRDEILAAVRIQLEAGRRGDVVARWIAQLQRDLDVMDIQRGRMRPIVVDVVRERVAQLLAITADDRPQSDLYRLKITAHAITTWITKFRIQYPKATGSQWRTLLTPVWTAEVGAKVRLLNATIEEVRQAKTDKASALTLLASAHPETHGDADSLGRALDRVDLAREMRRIPTGTSRGARRPNRKA